MADKPAGSKQASRIQATECSLHNDPEHGSFIAQNAHHWPEHPVTASEPIGVTLRIQPTCSSAENPRVQSDVEHFVSAEYVENRNETLFVFTIARGKLFATVHLCVQ
jgi:hypothetical protein